VLILKKLVVTLYIRIRSETFTFKSYGWTHHQLFWLFSLLALLQSRSLEAPLLNLFQAERIHLKLMKKGAFQMPNKVCHWPSCSLFLEGLFYETKVVWGACLFHDWGLKHRVRISPLKIFKVNITMLTTLASW
jgi:hypothetical protein